MENPFNLLDENQLKLFIDEYYNSEETVTFLLEEYDININKSKIASFLPLTPTTHKCVYCKDTYMMQKAQTRTDFRMEIQSDVFCPTCEHTYNKTFCNCDGCKDKESTNQRNIEVQKEEDLEEIISSQEEKEEYLVSLKAKMAYLTLLKYYVDENLSTFIPISHLANVKFSPEKEFTKNIIGESLEYCIKFSNCKENYDNVIKKDNGTYSYYPMECVYEPNKKTLKDNWINDELQVCTSPKYIEYDADEIIELWKEIGYYELIEYLYYLLENDFSMSRGIQYVGDKLKSTVKSILENFSVSQGYNIIWSSLNEAAASMTKRSLSLRHTINLLPSIINRSISMRLSGEWATKSYKRNYYLTQSALASVFFHDYLKIGSHGFNSVPSIEILEKYYFLDKDYEENELEKNYKKVQQTKPEIIEVFEDDFLAYVYEEVSKFLNVEDTRKCSNAITEHYKRYQKEKCIETFRYIINNQIYINSENKR